MASVEFKAENGSTFTAQVTPASNRFKGSILLDKVSQIAAFHASNGGITATVQATGAEVEGRSLEAVLRAVAYITSEGAQNYARRLFPYQAGELIAA